MPRRSEKKARPALGVLSGPEGSVVPLCWQELPPIGGIIGTWADAGLAHTRKSEAANKEAARSRQGSVLWLGIGHLLLSRDIRLYREERAALRPPE